MAEGGETAVAHPGVDNPQQACLSQTTDKYISGAVLLTHNNTRRLNPSPVSMIQAFQSG